MEIFGYPRRLSADLRGWSEICPRLCRVEEKCSAIGTIASALGCLCPAVGTALHERPAALAAELFTCRILRIAIRTIHVRKTRSSVPAAVSLRLLADYRAATSKCISSPLASLERGPPNSDILPKPENRRNEHSWLGGHEAHAVVGMARAPSKLGRYRYPSAVAARKDGLVRDWRLSVRY